MERWILAGSAAAGAGLMYLLDPQGGTRRRALVRDKVVRAAHKTADAADATARDVGNRARGIAAATRARRRGEAVPNDVLEARVRARMGRLVSHPHAVRVKADGGRITLEGPILAAEAPRLLKAVSGVRGVKDVENRLERHDTPGDIPALQGGSTRPGPRWELLQNRWSPATRLVVGSLSIAALGAGLLASRR
jgi:hypothetical protein